MRNLRSVAPNEEQSKVNKKHKEGEVGWGGVAYAVACLFYNKNVDWRSRLGLLHAFFNYKIVDQRSRLGLLHIFFIHFKTVDSRNRLGEFLTLLHVCTTIRPLTGEVAWGISSKSLHAFTTIMSFDHRHRGDVGWGSSLSYRMHFPLYKTVDHRSLQGRSFLTLLHAFTTATRPLTIALPGEAFQPLFPHKPLPTVNRYSLFLL